MQVRKQQLDPDIEQLVPNWERSKINAVYCHPAYLTYMQSKMWNARLYESQAGIKTAGRNINNLRYADDTTFNGRKWRGTKEPLDEGERGESKSWLKTQHSENLDHGIQSHHFMANRWGNNRNSDRLYFLGLQITVDGDCSHEIKTLPPWKKSKDQPRQHIKKQRHHFANKGPQSKLWFFL